MIKVFKTSVSCQQDADHIILVLQRRYTGSKVTFDLDDCYNVLRIEGTLLKSAEIIWELESRMFLCAEME